MVGAVEPLRPLCAGTSESAIAAAIESAFCGLRIFHKRRTGNAEKAAVSLAPSIGAPRFSDFRSSSSPQPSAPTEQPARAGPTQALGPNGARIPGSQRHGHAPDLLSIRIFQTRRFSAIRRGRQTHLPLRFWRGVSGLLTRARVCRTSDFRIAC